MPEDKHPTPQERDERVSIPLDPEDALKGLLKVDPEAEPVPQDGPDKDQGDKLGE